MQNSRESKQRSSVAATPATPYRTLQSQNKRKTTPEDKRKDSGLFPDELSGYQKIAEYGSTSGTEKSDKELLKNVFGYKALERSADEQLRKWGNEIRLSQTSYYMFSLTKVINTISSYLGNVSCCTRRKK